MPSISFAARFRKLAGSRWPRRLLLLLVWTATLGYFAFALVFLTLRYAILPHIADYRGDLEKALGSAFRLPVTVAGIEAQWQGLRPQLLLRGLKVSDAEGRPALGFDQVDAIVSWTSLLYLDLRLYRLEIVAPELAIRRDAQGRFFVAGLPVAAQAQGDDFSDWLLDQDQVVIRDATITWTDELRGAPPLALGRLNFKLENDGNRHRFGLVADPPRALAARLDIRGDFKGRDLDELEAWKGQAYLELDYADLAVWRTWVDYPVDLPRGSGGLRLWAGFARKELTSLTADLALADVHLRLRPDLPMMELDGLTGRFSGRRIAGGYEASARRLTMSARGSGVMAPTDFQLRWLTGADGKPPQGSLTAGGLDLAVVSRLASFLPLDAGLRERLEALQPRGHFRDMKIEWRGGEGGVAAYSARGGFDGVGIRPHGRLPGFEGLSGTLEATDKGGSLHLAGQRLAVDLPLVFPQPRIALDRLDLEATWKLEAGRVEAKLVRAAFANADATGEASGSYRSRQGGAGDIDLTAKLTGADGTAVWRYMPSVVGKDVRDWLRDSIKAGRADEATLRLKGDLDRFPFADGSGVFDIRGRFRDAVLSYATGWPGIDGIAGTLEFLGPRMTIRASKGRILGVGVGEVKAEIPDLTVSEEVIVIGGRARGPTADFLKFIEASPVGDYIDHFTEPMEAEGNGDLDLKLTLPLRKLEATRTAGRYRFEGNRLTVDPDLPPLSDVRGELRFTSDAMEARGIRAQLLGSPMTVDVKTQGDGQVLVNAAGEMAVSALRRQWPVPGMEHLSGATRWAGTVRVRKRSAEVRIASNLQGIASSLPEPFNKATTEAVDFRFERKAAPEPARAVPPGRRPAAAGPAPAALPSAQRDMVEVGYGRALTAQFVRRAEGDRKVLERGVVGVGDVAAALPDKGLLLAANLKRIDADFWRRTMAGANGNGDAAPLPPVTLDLRAAELTAYGKTLHDLKLAGAQQGSHWRADVASREMAGKVEWIAEGSGRLVARLARLSVPDTAREQLAQGEALGELPAIDLAVDQFLVRGKNLGEVRLVAENRDGAWNARLAIQNEDGDLGGEGRWRPSPTAPDTRLDFTLNAKSIEKLLARLGYEEAVRRGTATLAGQLSWAGAPFAIDYPSLSGQMKLEARGGQFNKLEPGVGRLLGVLSLQSLPRRITLDFRDIFSQGFAFDAIDGTMKLNRGIIDTQDLRIQGPAAKVLMTGTANISAETQNLRVLVQPAIGETIATGVILANPAIGAAAWLFNRMFGTPLDKVFAFEYSVTGTWADPKVEKIQGRTESARQEGTP
ncbi:MAG: TIGR02099 family protein [Rhodocyclaceae bacterium]|nr:TIGR02099 family protein [Rhodocyclaceae bacterium]